MMVDADLARVAAGERGTGVQAVGLDGGAEPGGQSNPR